MHFSSELQIWYTYPKHQRMVNFEKVEHTEVKICVKNFNGEVK